MKKRIPSDASYEQAARLFVGTHAQAPVSLVDNNTAPVIKGEPYYWTTPAGDIVDHIGAYRAAYGKPIYHPSTHRVEAGKRWLDRHPLRHRYGSYVVIGSRRTIHGHRIQKIVAFDTFPQWEVHRGTREYHVIAQMSPRHALRRALKAWHKQAKNLRRFAQGLNHPIEDIEVTAEDSVRAGNCKYGTARFIKEHRLGESIPADQLLAIQDTYHIRQAIAAADRIELPTYEETP